MNGISDTEVINALRRQMTIAAAKQAAAAGNLANIDTPNYKAVEVSSFADALDARVAAGTPAARPLRGGVAVTHPGHQAPAGSNGVKVEETRDTAPRRDGNTVVLDQELLRMGRAAGEFSAAQTALSAKFRLVRYAINEAR
jgi:flagellar basal-body rod protein FlgB